MAWYDVSWLKRKRIYITGGLSGAQTDYQLFITVDYEPEMENYYSDLRFTKSDGVTLLDAWFEAATPYGANVWVKTDTPADTVTDYIYMYYGNSDALDYWDGDATFLLYDNFDGTVLDSNKWGGVWLPEVSDSKVHFFRGEDIESKVAYDFDRSIAVLCRMKINEDYNTVNQQITIKLHDRNGVVAAVGCSWYQEGDYDRRIFGVTDYFWNGTNKGADLNSSRHIIQIIPSDKLRWEVTGTNSFDDTTTNTGNFPPCEANYLRIKTDWSWSDLNISYLAVMNAVENPATYTFGDGESLWYNSSWIRKIPITIVGKASGAQTDYQVKLIIPYDHDMKSDFSDLRFTGTNNIALLNCWLESYIDSISAIIWVKMDTPAYNKQFNIYMYYGNPNAVSAWDGPNTFIQYHGAATADYLDAAVVPSSNVAYESKIRSLSDNHAIAWGLSNSAAGTLDRVNLQTYSATNERYVYAGNDGSHTNASETPSFVTDVWYHTKVTTDGSTVRGYINDNEIASGVTVNLPDENMGLWLWKYIGSVEQEWSFVRKYVSGPPVYILGSEITIWYRPSWSKRRFITLLGKSSGTQIDYQVKLNIDYDQDMNPDFSDLRFTKSDGITLLDSWLEIYVESTSATVWVKTDTPADGVESIIYMYYDNYIATDIWNGSGTFIEFIDKDTTSGWTTTNLTISTEDDHLRFYNATSGDSGSAVRSISTPTKYAVEHRFNNVSLGSDDQCTVIIADGDLSNRKAQSMAPFESVQDRWYFFDGTYQRVTYYTEGTDYIMSYICDDSKTTEDITYGFMNTLRQPLLYMPPQSSYGTPTDVDTLYIGDMSTSAKIDMQLKWLMIRNIVDDPAEVTIGGEESYVTWYDSAWTRRKVIDLTGGSAGKQTDYQIKLTITYDDDMKSDFSDLRFTAWNGTTLLNSWLESKIDSTSAIIWVKTDTPVEDDNFNIYMYYGNAGVSDTWSGPDTFLQYHGAATSDFLDAAIVSPSNIAYEAKIKRIGTSNVVWGLSDHATLAGDYLTVQSYSVYRYVYAANEGTSSSSYESPNITSDTWVKALITNDNITVNGYIDDDQISTGVTTNLPDDNIGLYFHEFNGTAEQEWSFARKYVVGSATYTIGSEEVIPEWYNTSWNTWGNRKAIVLTGKTSGEQTDYQVKLDVVYDSDMKIDFSDLRFTKSDGITSISSWLESEIDSTSAIIWVKTDTPANGVEATIYMYYGSPDAPLIWSGSDTFIQYRDVEYEKLTDQPIIHPDNVAYSARINLHEGHLCLWGLMFDSTNYVYILTHGMPMIGLYSNNSSETGSVMEGGVGVTIDVWHDLLITNDGTNLCGYIDGDLIADTCITEGLLGVYSGLHIMFYSVVGTGEQIWSYAREFVIDPATYIFGDEETPAGGRIPIFMIYYKMTRNN